VFIHKKSYLIWGPSRFSTTLSFDISLDKIAFIEFGNRAAAMAIALLILETKKKQK